MSFYTRRQGLQFFFQNEYENELERERDRERERNERCFTIKAEKRESCTREEEKRVPLGAAGFKARARKQKEGSGSNKKIPFLTLELLGTKEERKKEKLLLLLLLQGRQACVQHKSPGFLCI